MHSHFTKLPQVALEVQLVDVLTSQIGGVIINSQTVLAAARYIQNCTTVIVIAGVHNRSAIEPTQQRRIILRNSIRIHPGFNPDSYEYNLALLLISTPFTFNCYVQPVQLPSNFLRDTFAGSTARTANWGPISESGIRSDVLLQFRSPVMENFVCDQATPFTISDNLICIESIRSNPSHCGSGSLLTIHRPCDSRPILIGLLAFIPANCETGNPFGYTRITSFMDWIQDTEVATNSYLSNKRNLLLKICALITVLILSY
jgi:transmembrane serine protease 9